MGMKTSPNLVNSLVTLSIECPWLVHWPRKKREKNWISFSHYMVWRLLGLVISYFFWFLFSESHPSVVLLQFHKAGHGHGMWAEAFSISPGGNIFKGSSSFIMDTLHFCSDNRRLWLGGICNHVGPERQQRVDSRCQYWTCPKVLSFKGCCHHHHHAHVMWYMM